ncbi:MAG TPA: hypothetical protein VHL34_14150 [Rhizomicrobium sp.]|jgi:hypothetical protein|nr:hypothetical protein [Rhizomicrobium sp.]
MSTQPHLKQVRLELARCAGFPDGSQEHGYELTAPLNADGSLSAELWRAEKDKCVVRRFWPGEQDRTGYLRHLGHGWRLDYDPETHSDDAPIFKLDRHHLLPGAYVSITENDGIQRPFKVISVVG